MALQFYGSQNIVSLKIKTIQNKALTVCLKLAFLTSTSIIHKQRMKSIHSITGTNDQSVKMHLN